jgi:hypothetical protein
MCGVPRLKDVGPKTGAVPDSENFNALHRNLIHHNVSRSWNHSLAGSINAAGAAGLGCLPNSFNGLEDSAPDGSCSANAFALDVLDDFLKVPY